MDVQGRPDPMALAETLERTIEDYERRFRLLDSQMRVLEKERQKLSAVVNNTDAGFLVIGSDMRLTWTNRAAPGILHLPEQPAMLGMPCHRVVCRSGEVCPTCPAARALRGGVVAHHELRLEFAGETRHIYATSIPILSPAGVVEEAVLMLQDVSGLQVLLREKALVQLLSEVAAAANEASTVEEAMGTAIDRICAHMEWPVGHVYFPAEGRNDVLEPSLIWHLEDRTRFEPFRRATESTPMPRGVGLPGRVLESGTAVWVADLTQDHELPRARAAQSSGIRGGIGFPVMAGREVVAVMEFFYPEAVEPDIRLLEAMRHIGTQLGRVIERDRAGRALRASEDQLRHAHKMEAVGRLAGGVAHDFNNLLTVISGHSELALARSGLDADLARELEEIKRAASRAAALTRQLLAFSRKQVLQPRVIDLNASVSDMDTMLRRLIGENIQLDTHLRPGLSCVRADRGQIEQVIMNLVVNARDAMPEGGLITIETDERQLGGEPDDRLPAVEPGRYVMLAVGDTGRGMNEETRARIFEPFFTTKELGKGTGLGLSTVYGIVRQSGGHIVTETGEGMGTTFRVFLPRAEGAAPATLPDTPPGTFSGTEGRPAGPAAPAGSETILLVEDEVVVRKLTQEILQRAGYRVLESTDPADARLLCERHEGPIHLMLSDVVMPMMSGIELAEYLAPIRPAMKVLFMSGYTDENLVSRAFIQKPFTTDGLAAKVREVLDGDGL